MIVSSSGMNSTDCSNLHIEYVTVFSEYNKVMVSLDHLKLRAGEHAGPSLNDLSVIYNCLSK